MYEDKMCLSMNVSYKKLWKLLIDKDMMKKDLQKGAGISWATLTKMSKGEIVSTEVLMKICKVLHCDVGDIVEFIDSGENQMTVKCHGVQFLVQHVC